MSETIPAGSEFYAGKSFEKTWVIRNTSPCSWNHQYNVVYYDGIGMGESTHRVFTENLPPDTAIHPGETTTLILNLRAPFAPGRHVGYWKLRDPSGFLFVPANYEQDSLLVDINVVGTIYSFIDNICQATWVLDGQLINCPDDEKPVSFVLDKFPHLEDGSTENEPGIRFLLSETDGSSLIASFPDIGIKKGDHLHLVTACAYDAPLCNLTFEVGYHSADGDGLLGTWNEISDGQMHTVDLDLSDLAGQAIQFVFLARSNGAIQGNLGFWFFPILLPY
ncbi:MAG: hypothetical protein JW704_03210 [Anaerolineaceae bacterium]|nr:hypothetical protein [Anaerolineaceae bacterium]MBN2678408.1 hypothetical protein [Anaerolineaceae bacterium]